MGHEERLKDIEVLARMAARLAGRDPDEHVKCQLGNVVAFEGAVWRYPDFLDRAEAAYRALDRDNPGQADQKSQLSAIAPGRP